MAVASTDGQILGLCGLTDVSEVDAHASVSVFLDSKYWGSGYAIEMLIGYIDLIFESTPARKLYFPMHEAVRSRARRIDKYMKAEGHLRDHVRIGDEWGDMYIYSLTENGYSELRERTVFRRVLNS